MRILCAETKIVKLPEWTFSVSSDLEKASTLRALRVLRDLCGKAREHRGHGESPGLRLPCRAVVSKVFSHGPVLHLIRAAWMRLPRACRAEAGLEFSSKLQRGQRKQRKHKCGDPESGDDLRLFPTQQLEMVMDRRHLEDPLSPELE